MKMIEVLKEVVNKGCREGTLVKSIDLALTGQIAAVYNSSSRGSNTLIQTHMQASHNVCEIKVKNMNE